MPFRLQMYHLFNQRRDDRFELTGSLLAVGMVTSHAHLSLAPRRFRNVGQWTLTPSTVPSKIGGSQASRFPKPFGGHTVRQENQKVAFLGMYNPIQLSKGSLNPPFSSSSCMREKLSWLSHTRRA